MTTLVIIVLVAIAADIVTGLIAALYKKEFASYAMREGLFHKVGEVCAVALLYGLEYAQPIIGIDTGLPLFAVGCGYLVLMEVGSILENIGKFTPGLSDIIKKGGGGK